MEKQLDVKVLDKIVKQTIGAVEQGKAQIYDIYEAARLELENVRRDVERIKQQTSEMIFKVDELEQKERRSRLRLMEVSRNFRVYTEQDVKIAYEETSKIQVDLAVAREQEQNLRRQRDNLEIRLKALKNTVEKAETLVAQVGAVLGFMGNQMERVLTQIDSIQQRQLFGAKIIKAQEEERRRVAREIHDGPAQAMANVVFRADVCERLIDTNLERTKAELKDLREQVRLCLKETRKIIFDLRPMTLDDLGLVPTVRRILEMFKDRTGVVAEIRIFGEEKRLDAHVETDLFRILQEALSNIEKHAQATVATVRMEFTLKAVTAIIEDNGQGFDIEYPADSDSFGLMGMKERIDLLDGELTIQSRRNEGTKITVRVPLIKPE